MYVCESCGALIRDGEFRIVREGRGEFWGAPCYKEVAVCPVCGSDDIGEAPEEEEREEL